MMSTVKLGEYIEYRDGTLDRLCSTTYATHATQPPLGGKYMHMWWNFCHNKSSLQDYPQHINPTMYPKN